MQILLYNQQYVFSCAAVTTAVTMTTVFHDSPSAAHDEMPFAVKNGIPAAAIADGAQYDYYYGDTAVSIASPSIVTVTLKAYNTGGANDEESTVTTKMITSHTSPSSDTVSDTESSSSAIYGEDSPSAVTIMTAVVKIMTNDMNATVYLAVIDAESSADDTESSAIIMMTTVFHELPFAIHDEISSAVCNDKYFAFESKLLSYDTSDAVTTDMACNTAVPEITKTSFANNDEDYSADSSSSAIFDGDSSAGNDSTAIIMMTTAFHESPSAIHFEIPCAVNDGISSASLPTSILGVRKCNNILQNFVLLAPEDKFLVSKSAMFPCLLI